MDQANYHYDDSGESDSEPNIMYILNKIKNGQTENFSKITKIINNNQYIKADDMRQILMCKDLINIMSLDLSNSPINDTDLEILSDDNNPSFVRLKYINLSETKVTVKGLTLLGSSRKIGSVQDQFYCRPVGDVCAQLYIKIHFLQDWDHNQFQFVYPEFHIKYSALRGYDVHSPVTNAVKLLTIEIGGNTYTEPKSPNYFDLVAQTKAESYKACKSYCERNKIPYDSLYEYSPKKFIQLLDNLAKIMTIDEILDMCGYTSKFMWHRMRKFESRMPAQDEWNVILMQLKRKGIQLDIVLNDLS